VTKTLSTVGFLILVLASCTGCGDRSRAGASDEVSGVTDTASRAVAEAQAGTPLQYRAVCTEAAAHGGTEYVLTRWLDSRDKAKGYGEYHGDFKEKGHRWRLEQRVKPQ
jgi:hypothetical protein